MPTFKAPQYSKAPNPRTGSPDPLYKFPIEFEENDSKLSCVVETQTEITLQLLQKTILENVSWWNQFITLFLQTTSKLFSKPYSAEQINKITRHTLEGTSATTFPANVTFLPRNIVIWNGTFTVNWEYTVDSMIIDIPGLETLDTYLPDSKTNKIEGIEELNIDDLPVDKNATDAPLELDSPAKFYDKQRVKEARLKAKLAVYKAQRQLAEYYKKYGQDISDSDTDYTTSDGEEESDQEAEDVQL
jgi:hypothetical protein